MQLLVLIMRDTEKLDELLLELSDAGIGGATILDCEGMAERLLKLKHKEDIPFFDLLSSMLDDNTSSGKMIWMVLADDKAERVRCIIREKTGGLDKPNTGIMFGIPLTFAEGIRF